MSICSKCNNNEINRCDHIKYGAALFCPKCRNYFIINEGYRIVPEHEQHQSELIKKTNRKSNTGVITFLVLYSIMFVIVLFGAVNFDDIYALIAYFIMFSPPITIATIILLWRKKAHRIKKAKDKALMERLDKWYEENKDNELYNEPEPTPFIREYTKDRYVIMYTNIEYLILRCSGNPYFGKGVELENGIQLCIKAEQFYNHSDLMTMNHNLKNSNDDRYRCKKLFEMYKKFYINDINGTISECDFPDVLKIIDNKHLLNHTENYSEIFSDIVSDKPLRCFSINEIVLCLNNPQLRERAKELIYYKSENLSLYIAFAKYISNHKRHYWLSNLIVYADDVVKELDKLQKEHEDEQERQRLLSGDMTYENNLEQMKTDLTNVKTGVDFENYLYSIFEKLGYSVTQTKGSGDKGVDLVLTKNGITYVIQAKFYSGVVGFDAIKEAHTGKDIYKADKAAVVTNNSFTRQAIETAATLNITLIDGDKLKAIVDTVARRKFIDVF